MLIKAAAPTLVGLSRDRPHSHLRLDYVEGFWWAYFGPKSITRSRSLTFPGTSNKLGNTIPLNDTAMSVLEEIQSSPVRHMNLVFTKNGNKLNPRNYPEWYRALGKCGLRGGDGEDFCWHGLRHTWASWMAQAGVPENVRKRLGGWSSREVVDRYSHLDLESLRPYASVIDGILKGDRNDAKMVG